LNFAESKMDFGFRRYDEEMWGGRAQSESCDRVRALTKKALGPAFADET
jgi:hypothetical protein